MSQENVNTDEPELNEQNEQTPVNKEHVIDEEPTTEEGHTAEIERKERQTVEIEKNERHSVEYEKNERHSVEYERNERHSVEYEKNERHSVEYERKERQTSEIDRSERQTVEIDRSERHTALSEKFEETLKADEPAAQDLSEPHVDGEYADEHDSNKSVVGSSMTHTIEEKDGSTVTESSEFDMICYVEDPLCYPMIVPNVVKLKTVCSDQLMRKKDIVKQRAICAELCAPECDCEKHRRRQYKYLTVLLLDCWQREYDARPYLHFVLRKNSFRERMYRDFESCHDWCVLIDFLRNRKLKSVTIIGVVMPDLELPATFEYFIDGLENVETIRLINVCLPKRFLQELLKNILRMKVTHLDLSHNEFTTEELTLIRCILVKSEILETLKVRNCSIHDSNFAIIADGIHKSKSLRYVDISRPCTVSHVSLIDTEKFMSVVTSLVSQNKLTTLILCHANLIGHDIEPICEYLALQHSQLAHLNIASNNITSHGTDILFKALFHNKTLKILSIRNNNLGEKGGIVIARLLSYTSIASLDISYNQIDSSAMFEVLTALNKVHLQILYMYGNKFDPRAAKTLKRILRARVLLPENVDVTPTLDTSKNKLIVVPHVIPNRIRI